MFPTILDRKLLEVVIKRNFPEIDYRRADSLIRAYRRGTTSARMGIDLSTIPALLLRGMAARRQSRLQNIVALLVPQILGGSSDVVSSLNNVQRLCMKMFVDLICGRIEEANLTILPGSFVESTFYWAELINGEDPLLESERFEALIQVIQYTFSDKSAPDRLLSPEYFSEVDNNEERFLQDLIGARSWNDLDPETLATISTDFMMFTPDAVYLYIPAYFVVGLRYRILVDSTVELLDHLSGDSLLATTFRRRCNESQTTVIIQFLEFIDSARDIDLRRGHEFLRTTLRHWISTVRPEKPPWHIPTLL